MNGVATASTVPSTPISSTPRQSTPSAGHLPVIRAAVAFMSASSFCVPRVNRLITKVWLPPSVDIGQKRCVLEKPVVQMMQTRYAPAITLFSCAQAAAAVRDETPSLT